jgi:hypothetical protein
MGQVKLLIHADPGARSGFVGAWLQSNLNGRRFDVGEFSMHGSNYFKIHDCIDSTVIKNFDGIKIRIRPSRTLLHLSMLLYLRKNVHVQHPDFSKDEYDLETWTKVYTTHKTWLEQDSRYDLSLYDYVIDFEDTYNLEKMSSLFVKVNNRPPGDLMLKQFDLNNALNYIELDPSHSCVLAALVLNKEHKMGVGEEGRAWSICDIYQDYSKDQRHQALCDRLTLNNYKEGLCHEVF